MAPKKPAIRATSPSVNYQAIVSGVMEALNLHDQSRTVEVNALQVPTSAASTGRRDRRNTPRQGSPAPSDAPSGSSRASPANRTVRFRDEQDDQSSRQDYGSSPGRSRWQRSQQSSSTGNNNGPRPRVDRQPGQGSLSSQPPTSGSAQSRWSGLRYPPPQSGNQSTPGQGTPRYRPQTSGNNNGRQNWRSEAGQQPGQQQPPPGQRW